MARGIDLAPLREREFRRLYVAGLVTALGSQATYVTVPYQLKQLTNSPLEVGALGLVEVVPLILFGLYGGVLADRLNRRGLILVTEAALMLSTVALLVNARLSHPQTWVLYVDAMVMAALASLQRPSVEALKQHFVAHDLQRAAAALASVSNTTASIVGPALGGLAAVALGPAAVYAANVVTFGLSLSLLAGLAATPVLSGERDTHASEMVFGLRYAASRPDLLGTYVVDLLAMVLAFPVVMLPFVAAHFHETYALSLLYCGLPGGALVATLISGWTRRVHHYGRAIVYAAALWGLGIAVFGYSQNLAIVLAGLAVAGGADAVSGIFRSTLWNESIPPEVRGRMAGIEMISYSLGPTAGQFRAGVMAAWTTLRFSLTFGGLACVGSVGAVALALPSLWRFDARDDANVAAVREMRSKEAS
ncbi:MAG TPA: MFS transporter [Acidimicrobiales bacterium]|nr:MFS transporter [Acidimicrobiales bacterium]